MPARYDYTGLADQPWALATRQLSERRSAGLVLSARRHTQDREGWDPRGGMRVPPTIIAVATGICPSSASSSLTGRGNPPVLRSGGRGMACVHLLDRDRPGTVGVFPCWHDQQSAGRRDRSACAVTRQAQEPEGMTLLGDLKMELKKRIADLEQEYHDKKRVHHES